MRPEIPLLLSVIAVASCDSKITNSGYYPAPAGNHTIEVIEELQGANDPAPWWTHVSLHGELDEKRQIPGNLLKLDGRGTISAIWDDDDHVQVYVDHALADTNEIPEVTITRNHVQIEFVVGEPPVSENQTSE